MKGIIYQIFNSDKSIVYVGSTTLTIAKRWSCHKSDFNRWLNGELASRCSIYEHFKTHGIDNFQIEVLTTNEIEDTTELRQMEQLVIDTTKCVNESKAFSSISKSDRDKAYYITHIEERTRYNKQYYDQNRAKLKERQRMYNANNRERQKATSAERIECGCGSNHRRGDKAVHLRSKKHQRWLAEQSSA